MVGPEGQIEAAAAVGQDTAANEVAQEISFLAIDARGIKTTVNVPQGTTVREFIARAGGQSAVINGVPWNQTDEDDRVIVANDRLIVTRNIDGA